MKNLSILKSIFLSVIVAILVSGCSASDEATTSDKVGQIMFFKSSQFDWKYKQVEVSFEDNFQNFKSINGSSVTEKQFVSLLSANNLKQGVTVRLKVLDAIDHSEKMSEIMIESFDLKLGLNQIAVGYKNDKPFIIY